MTPVTARNSLLDVMSRLPVPLARFSNAIGEFIGVPDLRGEGKAAGPAGTSEGLRDALGGPEE
jgi:hypothetical protein